jgi:phage FluMu protein Com
MKTCSGCNQVLNISLFSSHVKQKDGLQTRCRSCNKASSKAWNAANKDSLALKRIKDRALEKGVAFDLKLIDITPPIKCPVFGFDLVRNIKVPQFNSPSVDRIDPSKGYTRDNIQVMSQLANAMKQNANPAQLIQFAEWVLKTYQKDKNASD